jgi:hypothetical protein
MVRVLNLRKSSRTGRILRLEPCGVYRDDSHRGRRRGPLTDEAKADVIARYLAGTMRSELQLEYGFCQVNSVLRERIAPAQRRERNARLRATRKRWW